MTFRIFISYSQDDFLARGRKVRNYLSKVIPDSYVYIDQDKEKGEKWREKNDLELVQSQLMVLVITPAVLYSDEVKREIKLAQERGIKILPCKHDDLGMDWKELPLNLNELDGIRFEDDEYLRPKLFHEITKIIQNRKKEPVLDFNSALIDEEFGDFAVIVDKNKFNVRYSYENGNFGIYGSLADKDTNSIRFDIRCKLQTDVTFFLPRKLIDAKNKDVDDIFFVMIDGIETSYKEVSTKDERQITFTIPPDNSTLEIIGTEIMGITPGKRSGTEHVISLPFGSSVPTHNKLAEPEYLKISVGDTVTWLNDDKAAHTITSGSTTDGSDGSFDSSLFMSGATYSVTFEKPGIYKYFCMVHPWKNCIVEVT